MRALCAKFSPMRLGSFLARREGLHVTLERRGYTDVATAFYEDGLNLPEELQRLGAQEDIVQRVTIRCNWAESERDRLVELKPPFELRHIMFWTYSGDMRQ